MGRSTKLPIEVKTKKAATGDLAQRRGYIDELGEECTFGVLIALDFAKQVIEAAPHNRIKLVRYEVAVNLKAAQSFESICEGLSLHPLDE